MRLQGKTALVTGGTDGIGAQLIRQLRDKGVTVITQGRNAGRCAATRADEFEVIEADLGAQAGVDAVLKARGEAMVVNVTSGLAIAPRAGGPVYCATKAGLRSYSQALRAQLQCTHVHVLEALPPVVETKLTAGRGSNKMAPEECARQIVTAMERGADEANIGMVKLLQLVNSISPALARRIMLKF